MTQDNKKLARMCLEILSGVRSNLTVEELRSIGYTFRQGECELYRAPEDDAWRGTVKAPVTPSGVMGFDSPVKERFVDISSLAIDCLVRMLPESNDALHDKPVKKPTRKKK